MLIRKFLQGIFAFSITFIFISWTAAQPVVPPEDHFGFKLGSDYKLASWRQIHDYFILLDESSPRVSVTELGKTNQGRPFFMMTTSRETSRSISMGERTMNSE